MNLINGRNLGELPGLRIYTAPKKCDRSRINDVLMMVITVEGKSPKVKDFEEWGAILSEAYFMARGSFTMGITAALKQFVSYLDEKFPGILLPNVMLNIAVLRDRTLLIGHSGPVNTTVVYADHVDNFSDATSVGVSQGTQGLRFFQIEIHSGDLILMCPRAPSGWTNEAILDATGESPLNVIRYLMDQANGNLQGVVIQVKTGRGEILYRYKPPVITTVDLGYQEESEKEGYSFEEPSKTMPRSSERKTENAYRVTGQANENKKPLFRTRLPLEPFPIDFNSSFQKRTDNFSEEKETMSQPDRVTEAEEIGEELKSEPAAVQPDEAKPVENETAEELPPFLRSDKLQDELPVITIPDTKETTLFEEEYIFREPLTEVKKKYEPESVSETELIPNSDVSHSSSEKRQNKKSTRTTKKPRAEKKAKAKGVFSWKKFFLGLFFGILIPILVVAILFFTYTGRSKDTAYRSGLRNAVETAKIAVQQTEPTLQRISWEKVLEYLKEAAIYGNSPAAEDLRKQALESLDKLDNGILIPYHYALQSPLPKGTNLVKLDSTNQFLYALDAATGSIFRLNILNNGLSLDSSFSCTPGTYQSNQESGSDEQISVGKLVDFVILPAESGSERVVMGVDNSAQLLYCPSVGEKTAQKLESPGIGWLGVDAVYFTDRTLFILDAKNNSVWKVPYLGKSDFDPEPSTYFGTDAPALRDIVDFVIYEQYSYLLRQNGTLIFCDYTGYSPLCSYVDTLTFYNDSQSIDLTKKHVFQINMNRSPDTSIYLMDRENQSLLNTTIKLNLIRNLVPDRFEGDGDGKVVTAFGFIGQFQVVWASQDQLFVGALN